MERQETRVVVEVGVWPVLEHQVVDRGRVSVELRVVGLEVQVVLALILALRGTGTFLAVVAGVAFHLAAHLETLVVIPCMVAEEAPGFLVPERVKNPFLEETEETTVQTPLRFRAGEEQKTLQAPPVKSVSRSFKDLQS